MKEKRHPEITRREFMGGTWKLLNVGAFITLGGHLGSLAVTSTSSGHPDSLTCYECRACASTCPWKLDPSGYLVAARVNNPNRRMLAQYNVRQYNRLIGNREEERRITVSNLKARDKHMRVVIGKVTKRERKHRFDMDLSNLTFIAEGTVPVEIRKVFEAERWAISSTAQLTQVDLSNWMVSDDPEIFYIQDTGTVLSVEGENKEYDKKDPMQVRDAEEELEESDDVELTDIYEMRAKDSAFYDPLCTRCEPPCPVALRITKFISDVKADGKYR